MASPLGPGPLVYAHRGASARARDNTIEAFLLAIDERADGIELDVQATSDQTVVVHHDMEHGTVGPIATARFAELRRADPGVPTLDEAFDAIAGRCHVDIELKQGTTADTFDRSRHIARLVPPIVERHRMGRRVLVSSFDPVALRVLHEEDPKLPTGQLLRSSDPLEAIAWTARDGHASVCVNRSWLTPDPRPVVELAHRSGLAVCAWTVDEPDEVRALASAGVAVIITDDPLMARRALSDD